MPTGLVKSTIHAPGWARRRIRSARPGPPGPARTALPGPPAPVVSWPTQLHSRGNVSSLIRAFWPPTRSCRTATSASVTPASRSVVHVTLPGWPYRPKMRAAKAPTISSRSAAGSIRTSSSTDRPESRSRANPSANSGVYVDPPPMTAILTLAHSSLEAGQRDALHERALGEEEDDDQRGHGQHRCGRDEVPVDVVDGAERRQAQRQRPGFLVLAGV